MFDPLALDIQRMEQARLRRRAASASGRMSTTAAGTATDRIHADRHRWQPRRHRRLATEC